MSAQRQPRTAAEMALIEAHDALDDLQEIAAAIMLAARGILNGSDRKGMLYLAELLHDRCGGTELEIHRAQKALGFAEGGSR